MSIDHQKENSGTARLHRLCSEICMSGSEPKHYRTNLLDAVLMFAELKHDHDLVAAVQMEIERIVAERSVERNK